MVGAPRAAPARSGTWLDRVLRFASSDLGTGLLVAIAWQGVMTVAGLLFEQTFSTQAAAGAITPLSHTDNWDGGWYRAVIDDGIYRDRGGGQAFFPLFPLIVLGLRTVTLGHLGTLVSGLVVNTVATALAIVALVRIADRFVPRPQRWIPVAVLLASPAALFLHVFYAEAVLCALCFWAYLAALQRRWPLVGVLLALGTATRVPAFLFVVLCGLEYLRSCGWRARRVFQRDLAWFALAPVGWLAYAVYLQLLLGNPLAMFQAYDDNPDWRYHVFSLDIVGTVLDAGRDALGVLTGGDPFTTAELIRTVLPVASLAVLLAVSLRAIALRRATPELLPLGLFGLTSIVFFTLNSNVVSVHRYVVSCVVIPVVLTVDLAGRRAARAALAMACQFGLALQTYLFILFVTPVFAG